MRTTLLFPRRLAYMLSLFMGLLLSLPCAALAAEKKPAIATKTTGAQTQDPYRSAMWDIVRDDELGKDAYVFDNSIVITAPPYAEDPMSVPLQIDATALQKKGLKIERMIVAVDRNPIRKILEFQPMLAKASISVRFKLEQSSPIRAMVKTSDGLWHVGTAMVEASGGGCTVAGQSRKDGSWQKTLLNVQAKFFKDYLQGGDVRLRLRVMHPMDTGLVAGIPAFYLEDISMQDGRGAVWWKLKLYEPVAENPIISLDFANPLPSALVLLGRDNNGGQLEQSLQP